MLGTPDARNYFVRILNDVRLRFEFRLIGYVVMPEHVHLLVGEPSRDDLSKVVQILKQRVAFKLLSKDGDSAEGAERHFWLRRYYDFNIYSGKKITEKLTYMHLTPVKRKLVVHPRDWPWSSWSHYANEEPVMIPIDRWDEPTIGTENPHP